MKKRILKGLLAAALAVSLCLPSVSIKAEARIPSRDDYEDILWNRGEYKELFGRVGYGPANKEKAAAVLDKAIGVVKSAPAAPHEKVKYFHDWICKNTKYEIYGGVDSSAAGVFEYGKAKCSGYASALDLLCTLADIPCYKVMGSSYGEPHAWNIVQLEDGEWYEVDCTFDDNQGSKISYSWFLLTTKQMNSDHTRGAYQLLDMDGKMLDIPIANGTLYAYNKKPLKVGNASYKVTDVDTVEYAAPAKSAGSIIKIPETISINGKDYKVTAISKDAFKGNKKIKKVVIESNIKTIGDSAFEKCINLKQVDMSKCEAKALSKKLFKGDRKLSKIMLNGNIVSDVGKNALKGIAPKCKIQICGKTDSMAGLIRLLKRQGARKARFK